MTTSRVSVELSDDLLEFLGVAEEVGAAAKEGFVLNFVRNGAISQCNAAEMLVVTRCETLDLLVQYRVPSAPLTPEEADQEIEVARAAARHRPEVVTVADGKDADR